MSAGNKEQDEVCGSDGCASVSLCKTFSKLRNYVKVTTKATRNKGSGGWGLLETIAADS